MKINRYLLGMVSFIAFSSYLQAATLDYRHEYADRTRINKDRIAIIEKLPNGIGFYVDASVKSGGVDGEQDKHLSDLVANAIELGVSYNYKVTDHFVLQPGFIFESGPDTSIYKPYLRGNIILILVFIWLVVTAMTMQERQLTTMMMRKRIDLILI